MESSALSGLFWAAPLLPKECLDECFFKIDSEDGFVRCDFSTKQLKKVVESAILNVAVFFKGEKSVQRCGNETIL